MMPISSGVRSYSFACSMLSICVSLSHAVVSLALRWFMMVVFSIAIPLIVDESMLFSFGVNGRSNIEYGNCRLFCMALTLLVAIRLMFGLLWLRVVSSCMMRSVCTWLSSDSSPSPHSLRGLYVNSLHMVLWQLLIFLATVAIFVDHFLILSFPTFATRRGYRRRGMR